MQWGDRKSRTTETLFTFLLASVSAIVFFLSLLSFPEENVKILNAMAMTIIRRTLGDDDIERCCGIRTAHELWLQSFYDPVTVQEDPTTPALSQDEKEATRVATEDEPLLEEKETSLMAVDEEESKISDDEDDEASTSNLELTSAQMHEAFAYMLDKYEK